MKHILLRFFLIFACVAIPLHSHACWDDCYDDYYDYDDYDYDDWDWDCDDWDWNDDDDDDIVYGEIDESNYDMNGGELDEVVVTPDTNDSNDDDWWRTDYGDDDDYGNDDDWFDYDEDGDTSIGSYHPDNNNTTTNTTPPLLPNEVHTPVDNEKLFKDDLPARYPYQTNHNNCFTTTLAICNALTMGDFDFKYYNGYLAYVENTFSDTFGRDISEEGIYPCEVDRFITNGCNLEFDYITSSEIASCIDDGDIVMVTIANGSHEVAIVGYYDDLGVDAYQCVNPGNGMYETHYVDEFKHGSIIRYSKNN